jgi:purine-binding chemotaxis protein CheW
MPCRSIWVCLTPSPCDHNVTAPDRVLTSDSPDHGWMYNMTTAVQADELLVTTFRLGDWLLGIEISAIREINRVGEMTPVPDAPAAVRGVINLRGDVVTVLDLRTILECDPAVIAPESRLIIVEADDEHIGLLVDRVEDVMTVTTSEEESLPPTSSEMEQRYFRSVYKLEPDLLVLLDVSAIVGDTGDRS